MKRVIFILMLIAFVATMSYGVVSKKKVIAIFGTSTYDPKVSNAVLGRIDEAIVSIFVNMKRFEIQGYGNYRLSAKNVQDFVKKIREIREAKADVGKEAQQFGDVMISADDFDKIVNSFIIIAPTLVSYQNKVATVFDVGKLLLGKKKKTSKVQKAIIKVSYVFIDAAKAKQFAQFTVEATGTAKIGNKEAALEDAINNSLTGLKAKTELKTRKLDAFKLQTEVIKRDGGDVVFELGKNFGIKTGYEFYAEKTSDLGEQSEVGYVRVSKVSEKVTRAKILWGDIKEGDQLIEYPLLGWSFLIGGGVMPFYIKEVSREYTNVPFNGVNLKVNLEEQDYAPFAVVGAVRELGFAGRIFLNVNVAYSQELLLALGDLGFAYRIYMGRVSLDLGIAGSFGTVRGTLLDDILESGDGLYLRKLLFGGIGMASFNIQFSKTFIMSLGGGFRAVLPIGDWEFIYEEADGTEWKLSEDDLSGVEVGFTGPYGQLTFEIRF